MLYIGIDVLSRMNIGGICGDAAGWFIKKTCTDFQRLVVVEPQASNAAGLSQSFSWQNTQKG